jgi:hypothetical protein
MINNRDSSPSSVKIFKKAANNVIEKLDRRSPLRKDRSPVLISHHQEGVNYINA